METRKIGSLNVPLVGIGCNNFGGRIDEAATRRVIDAALDAGANFFDTADIYGKTLSEEFMGRILEGRRSQAIIATKFGIAIDEERKGGGHPDYIRRAAEDSLRRLRTDYIDLYQIHRPDPNVPIADTLGALNELVKAGKVRELGCSNFSAEQLREAAAAVPAGSKGFVSVQNEYSLLKREPQAEVLPECERQGLGFLPYFPLASGLLTGKYRKGQPAPPGTRGSGDAGQRMLTDENLDRVEMLLAFATERGHSLLELAMSWLARQPVIASVIAGATKPEQVAANVASVDWKLTPEELREIDSLLAG